VYTTKHSLVYVENVNTLLVERNGHVSIEGSQAVQGCR
jgi:hypothetical protein